MSEELVFVPDGRMQVERVTLQGYGVRLEPMAESHIDGLCEVGFEPSLWLYMMYGTVDSREKMAGFVHELLRREASGSDRPFVVVEADSGKVIGCTRYMDIRAQDWGLEIGGTWYGLAYQRTHVNTACKFLLLQHAFESIGALRVQLKTDLNNLNSQRAIARIGAKREGVLRNHVRRPEGSLRSSVYFSILASEWPEVRQHLLSLLERVSQD